MATFKIRVRTDKKRKDGTYKVIIRVIHNRTDSSLKSNWFVSEKDLKKDGTIKNAQIKLAIDRYLLELQDWCNRNALRINNVSAKELVSMLESKDDDGVFTLDFVQFVRDCADKLIKDEREGTGKLRLSAINSFVRYIGKEYCDINDITTNLINGWMRWIIEQPAPKGKRGTRAPRLYFNQLRVCFGQAKDIYNDEDAGIINIPREPFAKAIVPKEKSTPKRALTAEQIRAIINMPYEDEVKNKVNRFNLAKDVFTLSFCLMGMNAVDLYYCTELKGDKLAYERTKTRTRRDDNARIELTIPEEIKPLVEKYKGGSVDRVFRFSKMYSTVGTFSCALNKGLKEIGKRIGVDSLQFYAARHSWATIAVNDCRIDKYTVHQALNHVGDKTAITDIYIKKDWKITDEANRKVMSYIFAKE